MSKDTMMATAILLLAIAVAVLAYDRYMRPPPPTIEESLTRAIERTSDAIEDAADEIEDNLKGDRRDRRREYPPQPTPP